MDSTQKSVVVSVIVPTYNCRAFLAKALDSVFAQTFREFELIVVDDGSTDNTAEVLKPYSGDNRLRYLYQQNSGVAAARNAGAHLSQAEYLAFLDADDMLAPNALERMKTALDQTRASWCLVDILKINGDKREIRRSNIPDRDLLHCILAEDFICRGMFFRRQDFIEVGMYDENMRCREDWDINIRMFESNRSFVYLPEPLYLYSWREGSITTGNRVNVLHYTEQLLRKHHKRLADEGDKAAAKLYAKNMWILGREYFYETAAIWQTWECTRESFAYDRNVRRLVHPLIRRLSQVLR